MNTCPNCKSPMRVTNTYRAGETGSTQRLKCTSRRCGTVAVTVTVLQEVNPAYGKGAAALARKLAKEKATVC